MLLNILPRDTAFCPYNGFSFNMNIFKIYMSVSLKDAALSTLETADAQ